MSKIFEIICDDGVCSECQKYAGKFNEIPEHIPPFHPNCKCKLLEVDIENEIQLISEINESNCNLDDVIKVKEKLYKLGYYIPEKFEDKTFTQYPNESLFNAIANFQKDMNLPVTKIIKPNDITVDAINNIFNTCNSDLIFKMKKDNEFQKLVSNILKNEGGYKPKDGIDRGGETNLGISELWYPNEDIKNMNRLKASYFYYRDYYIGPKIYKLPLKLREIVFDNAVNQGQPTAIKNLQKALNVKVDGVIGPKTLNAVEKSSFEGLKVLLKNKIKETYNNIIKNDPKQIFNKNGWENRLNRY